MTAMTVNNASMYEALGSSTNVTPAPVSWTGYPSAPDIESAAANRASLQAALAGGNKRLTIQTQGTFWVDNGFVMESNTELIIPAGVTLKLTPGAARQMIVNNAFRNPVFTPIQSITATGNLVTATSAGHPFTAGQWIFVEGVGARWYNGCVRVHATTANTYSYFMPGEPTNLAPTVFTGLAMVGLTWAMQACPADVNIQISGGGTIDWNGQNQTFPNNIDTYAVLLHRVYSPRIYDIAGVGALKYQFCIAGSNGLRARSIRLDGMSDGFDLMAPCFNAVLDGVSGNAGDDFVSILCGDTITKTFSVGDMHNVVVNNIKSESAAANPSSLAAIKMAGTAPFIFDEVHGTNISGTGRLSATIAIIDDSNMVGGSIGNVSFTNIDRYITGASTNGEILQMRMTGTGGRIKVRGAVYNGTAGMGIRVDSVANFDELDYEITCDKACTGLPLIQNFGTIGTVRQKANTGPLFAGYIGQTAGASANVGAWYGTGTWKGTTAAKGVYHSAGTLGAAVFDDVGITNVRTLFEMETGALVDPVVMMNNINASGGLGLALIRRGAAIHLNNISAPSLVQAAIIDSNNGFTVNAYTNPTVNIAANMFTLGATNTQILHGGSNKVAAPAFSATPTYNFANGNIINNGILTANVTAITFAAIPPAGERVTMTFTQDATGARTIAWPATCIFPTAWVDAIGADANKKCTVNFVSNGTQLIAQGANKWA